MKNVISFDCTKEIIIKKSRFICLLFKLENLDLVNKYIDDVKKNYKGANHYCYAYIIGSMEKCSDDGEPSGTAGMPILNILKKNNLVNVLCVVVRYFGGIKLGAAGLIRAYGNSVNEALKETKITEYITYTRLNITISYENIEKVKYILKEYNILEEIYQENIKLIVEIPSSLTKNIVNKLEPICKNISY